MSYFIDKNCSNRGFFFFFHNKSVCFKRTIWEFFKELYIARTCTLLCHRLTFWQSAVCPSLNPCTLLIRYRSIFIVYFAWNALFFVFTVVGGWLLVYRVYKSADITYRRKALSWSKWVLTCICMFADHTTAYVLLSIIFIIFISFDFLVAQTFYFIIIKSIRVKSYRCTVFTIALYCGTTVDLCVQRNFKKKIIVT